MRIGCHPIHIQQWEVYQFMCRRLPHGLNGHHIQQLSVCPYRLYSGVISSGLMGRIQPLLNSLEAIFLDLQFLRWLAASNLQAVFLVLLFVDVGGFVEDFEGLIVDLPAGAILDDCRIAPDPTTINRDLIEINHDTFRKQVENLHKHVWERLAIVSLEVTDRTEVRL